KLMSMGVEQDQTVFKEVKYYPKYPRLIPFLLRTSFLPYTFPIDSQLSILFLLRLYSILDRRLSAFILGVCRCALFFSIPHLSSIPHLFSTINNPPSNLTSPAVKQEEERQLHQAKLTKMESE